MAVTLKQIREKRELLNKFRADVDSLYVERQEVEIEYKKTYQMWQDTYEELAQMGRDFAFDEGESFSQEKLDLPEPEESPAYDDNLPF